MMSLEQQHNSGDEEQDDFDETIDMVHGIKTEKKRKKRREIDTQPEKGCKKAHFVKQILVPATPLGQATDGDVARPLSAKEKDKQKAKEAKARKEKEKEERKREKKNGE